MKTIENFAQSELLKKYGLELEFENRIYRDTVLKVSDINRSTVRRLAREDKLKRVELALKLPFFDNFSLEVVEVKNGIGYVDSDIEVGPIQDLITMDSIGKSANAVVYSYGLDQGDEGLWPGGLIPYQIKTSDFSAAEINDIERAIDSVNLKTNLTLIKRNTQDDYVKIERNDEPGVGSSPVGKCGSCVPVFHNSHVIRLGLNVSVATIIHEFFHTAGVYHEQSRPDRDDFVTINFDCIQDGKENNFKKRNGTTYGPYDINSLMHYSGAAFNKPGSSCNTITANDGNSSPGGNTLTANDIDGLLGLYNSAHGKDGSTYLLTLDKERDARDGFTIVSGSARVILPPAFPNDEIYGLRVRNFPRGAIIRLYDDRSDGGRDDWAEVIFKRDVTDLVIHNFERNSNANPNYKIVYNTTAGSGNLNGKVSRIEVDLDPSPPASTTNNPGPAQAALRPRIILREGNNATQDFVGTITDAVPNKSFNLTQVGNIDNDEARSMVLYDIRQGTVIRVFDNSRGSKLDDWAEVIVKRNITQKVIGTFERSFEDADVRVIYFKEGNLDGKVSRLEISNTPTGPMLALYSGSFNTGKIEAVLPLNRNYNINCTSNSLGIPNDDITYLKLYNARAGTRIFLFDSSKDRYWKNRKEDDWTEVQVRRDLKFENIPTFERTIVHDLDVLRLYFGGGNLDGKVSYIQIRR